MPAPKRPKLSPEEQSKRFIETAREAGASEDERDFDMAIRRVAAAKSGSESKVLPLPSDRPNKKGAN